MTKFSRRRLLAALTAPVAQLLQYPYDTRPTPVPMTDLEQDEEIRKNAASNLFLWGIIQLAWQEIQGMKKQHMDPQYMQEWEVEEKDA